MLYMIQSWGENQESSIKIGFSDDVDKRLKSYFCSNPYTKVLGTKEGSGYDEKKIQMYLTLKGHKRDFLNEWFKVTEEVLGIFSVPMEEIEKYIWENREKIWTTPKSLQKNQEERDSKVISKLDVYEDLREKFLENKEDTVDVLNRWYLGKEPNVVIEDDLESDIKKFLSKFSSTGFFTKKLRMYCEFLDENKHQSELINSKIKDTRYFTLYSYFGTSGCRSHGYRELDLMNIMGDSLKEDKLRKEILAIFKIGERYTHQEIKKMLSEIYRELGISRTPKAINLRNYFTLQETRVTNKETGKRVPGYNLLPL